MRNIGSASVFIFLFRGRRRESGRIMAASAVVHESGSAGDGLPRLRNESFIYRADERQLGAERGVSSIGAGSLRLSGISGFFLRLRTLASWIPRGLLVGGETEAGIVVCRCADASQLGGRILDRRQWGIAAESGSPFIRNHMLYDASGQEVPQALPLCGFNYWPSVVGDFLVFQQYGEVLVVRKSDYYRFFGLSDDQ